MNILLDTNILLRAAEPSDDHHPVTIEAVAALRARGDTLCLVPQNFYEFWVVSTRPLPNNGRGRTPTEVAAELAFLKARFSVLGDTPAVLAEWEKLVTTHAVIGKTAHDTRMAAAMKAHGITHILTFNTDDFKRYPGITVLDPKTIAASATPPSTAP